MYSIVKLASNPGAFKELWNEGLKWKNLFKLWELSDSDPFAWIKATVFNISPHVPDALRTVMAFFVPTPGGADNTNIGALVSLVGTVAARA